MGHEAMSRFGSNPRTFFDAIYRAAVAPWDIGAAQPDFMRLLDEFPPATPVLDVGCGSGDLAIALAERGFDTIGVDFAEHAISQAREKARGLPLAVAGRLRFMIGDALRPSSLGETVGAVVDSGFLHLFESADRDVFVADLAAALPPGARYYLLAFAVTYPIENAPLQVDADEIAARFSSDAGWRILASRPAEFLSRVATVPAIAACVERV